MVVDFEVIIQFCINVYRLSVDHIYSSPSEIFMVKLDSYIDVVIITDSYFYFLVNGAVSMMCMGTFLGSLQRTQLHP